MSDEIKEREPCPQCLKLKGSVSRNNLAVYSDGKFCMSCGYFEGKHRRPLVPGNIVALDHRGITKDICEKYNVRRTDMAWGYTVIFPVYADGHVVKQKLKCIGDKHKQDCRGDSKNHNLFGMNTCSPTKKLPILITEGEEDALALHQMLGNLPVVSITNGAKGASKQLTNNIEWLSGFKEIILCFDSDKEGKEAVEECTTLFEPGFVRVASFPLKDANEMLLAGKYEETKKAIISANVIRPSTIIFPDSISDAVLKRPSYGASWPWSFMDKVTFGARLGEVYMIAADAGIGKTEFMYSIVTHWLNNGCKVGLIDLERQNHETMQRIIGHILNKKIWLPDCPDFDKEEISKELVKLKDSLGLYRADSGKLTLESILINIRYLNKGYSMNYFVLDNLTALSSNDPNVKDYDFASFATGRLVQLAKELNVLIFIINHLVKDTVQLSSEITAYNGTGIDMNGLTWETGRIPGIANFYGGGKVSKLPDYVIALARNRLSDDEKIKRTLVIKFLKTRFDPTFDGEEFRIIYDPIVGKYVNLYEGNTYGS